MRKSNYKKEQIIFLEQDKCNEIGFIEKGCIKIVTYTVDGYEYLIKTLNEKEYFGIYLLFSNDPYYQGNVIASKDTTISFYSKDEIFELCKNKDFFNQYMLMISLDHLQTQKHYKIISQNKLNEKILMYIKLSPKDSNGFVNYNSLEELALYLGIPRPSLSRELINLEKKKIIYRNNKAIRLL